MKKVVFYICLTLVSFSLKAQYFKEVSNELGVDYVYPGNDYQEVGAGVTIIDVNNDGWDDIFQSGGLFPSKLWLNQKGKFVDASHAFGLEVIDTMYVQGVVAADFDNDGYEDLFIGNMAIPPHRGDDDPPMMLKNINGEHFEPIFMETFAQKGHYPGASWGDINSDGYLDLYVLNYVEDMANGHDENGRGNSYIPYCLPNLLFINNQGKGFTEAAAAYGVNDEGCGLACCFTDFDNDNDVDLILLNDFGSWNDMGNKFYENVDGQLKDITTSMNFSGAFYGMGVGPGDYDNDGLLDYYLTNIGQNRLFHNQQDVLEDVAQEKQVDLSWVSADHKGTSWSGLFFDLENDGDQDLFITKGHLETIEPVIVKDENQLFLNSDKGSFDCVSEISGINDSLMHRGAAFLDFDHDGDLDIVCGVIKDNRSEFARTDQKIKIYENETKNKNNWIGIKLVGQGTINKSCVGCSVSIYSETLGYQIKEVDGGSGHSSQSSKVIYFGLGQEKTATNIVIQWIGGEETHLEELKAGKAYEIHPDGTVKVYYK
jgi:hypothetical protein